MTENQPLSPVDQVTSHLRKRKRFLKRFLDALVLFVLTYAFYWLFHSVFSLWLKVDWLERPSVLLGLSVLIAVLFYKPIDYFIFVAAKRLLFRRSDQYFLALMRLVRDLMSVLDLRETANSVVTTVGETVRVKTASLMVYDQTNGTYEVVAAHGMTPPVYRKIQFPIEQPLVDTLRTYGIPLLRERFRKLLSWQEANRLTSDFEVLQASCVVPIVCQEQLIGSLNIGSRLNGEPFRDSEVRFFGNFAKELGPVLRNAIMVEELKRANQDLMQVQAELIQSTRLSAIEQLATGLAHEIHNPLTIISGKAQVLLLKKDKKGYDDKVEEVLKTIVKQTKRAADITRKLLMFSQGKGTAREAISFETIINDTVSLVSYQMALDDVRVVKQVDHHLPIFYANPSAFREVFLNLFLNAVQAVGKSGMIQVSVRHKSAERTIEIRMADTGVGIGPEDLKRLFNPFFTTRKDATGLGLFVTQQIVHQYNGTIRVESKTGEGTIVVIQLPVGSELREDQAAERSFSTTGAPTGKVPES